MRQDDESPSSVPVFGAIFLFVLAAAAGYLALIGQVSLKAFVSKLSSQEAGAVVQDDLVALTIAQVIGMGTALFLGLRMFAPDQSLREALYLHPVRSRTLVLCLLAGAALQFPLAELSNFVHAYILGPDSLEKQLHIQALIEARTLTRGMLVVICIVALIPLSEELLFRGLFTFGLTHRHGRVIAVLTSACLFGLAHLDAATAVYATLAGVVLASLALATRSLWPSFAVHAAINAMPVLLPERVLPIPGFNIPSATPLHIHPLLWGTGLLLGSLLLAFARRIEYAAEP